MIKRFCRSDLNMVQERFPTGDTGTMNAGEVLDTTRANNF